MSAWNEGRPAVVITGGTSGLGRAALLRLLRSGADVVAIGRSEDRCASLESELQAEFTTQLVRVVPCDLSTTHRTREGAEQIRAILRESGHLAVDVLINNAAVASSWRITTAEGYESQFAVNHLAPFLLTNELMPQLQLGYPGRVIVVTSGSHRNGRIHWGDPMLTRGYSMLRAYRQSKLANVLFCTELNQRYAPTGRLRAYAYDPGLMRTDIGSKSTAGIERMIWGLRVRSPGAIDPDVSARALVRLALNEVPKPDRFYRQLESPARPARRSTDLRDAARLWAVSAKLCASEKAVPH